MRLLITCNSDSATHHFRSDYLYKLNAHGVNYEVLSINNLGYSKELSNTTSNRHQYLNLRVCYQLICNKWSFSHFHGFTHLGNLLVLLCFWRLDKIIFTITGQGKLFMYRRYFIHKILLILFYRAFRNKAVFIVQNNDDYIYYKEIIGVKKVLKTAGSGVRICRDMKLSSKNYGKTRIGFASRPNRDKGYHIFLDAVELFHNKFRFVRAGSKPIDNKLSRREKKVISMGWIDNLGRLKDMDDFFNAVDIVVLLSNYREGVPRLLLESMNHNKLVLAIDTFGVRDHLNQNNGYLIENVNSFFDLLEAGSFDFSRSDKGKSYAEEYFDVIKVIDVYLEALSC